MATQIGNLVIEMSANVARLQADMNQAKQHVKTASDNMSSAVGTFKTALGALGLGVSLNEIRKLMMGVIDAADAFNDLSKRTGLTVEQLSAWKLATEQSGTSMDALANALGKAGKYMVEHADNLKAIGITGRTAEETMIQLAGVISSLPADDPRRVALAMEVLGKSAGELLPLLSEGEAGLRGMLARGQELSPVTSEMAREADLFNDRLAETRVLASSLGVTIANDLLPWLNSLLRMLTVIPKASEGFWGAFTGVMANEKDYAKSIDDLTKRVATLKKLQSELDPKASFANKLNESIPLFGGDYSVVSEQLAVAQDELKTLMALEQARAKDVDMQKAAELQKANAVNASTANLIAIDRVLQNQKAEGNKRTTDFAKQEADHLRKLMEQEEQLIARRKESQAQALDAMAREVAGWNELTEAQRVSWEIQAGRYKNFDASTQRELVRLAELLDARNALAEAQKRFAADEAEQQRIAEQVMEDATDQTLEEMRKQKQAHDDLWASIDRTAHDTFVSIFDSGKNAFTRLKDMIKNTFFDWLYSMTIKKWIFNIGASTAGMGAAGSAAASLLPGSSGTPLGGGGILGSLGKAWDVFTGGFESANASFLSGISDFGMSVAKAGGMFSDLGSWISTNNALLGNIAPFAGAAFSLLTGDVKGAISSGIGTGIGMAIGGPVGGIIGGALSGVLGGMFGSKKVPHPAAGATAQIGLDGQFGITQSSGKHISGSILYDPLKTALGTYMDVIKALGGKQLKAAQLSFGFEQTKDQLLVADNSTSSVFSAKASDPESVSKAIQASILTGIKAGVAEIPLYLKRVLDKTEISTENVTALVQSLTGFKQLHDQLALMPPLFQKISTALDLGFVPSLEAAQASLAGVNQFYELFYTDAEKFAQLQKSLNSQFSGLNLVLPESRDEYRKLVEGIDATTESGFGLFNALVSIAPQMDSYLNALNAQNEALQTATQLSQQSFASKVDFTRYQRIADNYGATFAADYTSNMASGRIQPGENSASLVEEIKALRAETRATALASAETSRFLRRWNNDGMPEVRTV